jgi:cob(I)alamin adenosyltransferase
MAYNMIIGGIQMSLTTTQRLAQLETAQETIGLLMAELSATLWRESRQDTPDQNRIDALESQFDACMHARDSLRLDDEAGLQRALAKYGPMARASLAKATVALTEAAPG